MHSMKMKKEEMMGTAVGVVVVHKRSDSSSAMAAAAAAHHVGNKVLPITSDITAALPPMVPSSRKGSSVEQDEKRDIKLKGDNISNKSKAISRMKELIRWAAASKSDKNGKFLGRKVLQQFRNRSAIKGMQTEQDPTGRSNKYNYESNNHVDSPRFSLRWEVESSCSTTCSSMSMASCPAALHADDNRKANWITTDSDFVVLEL